ncbi:MAG TPA: DUF484 family protein [Alphaproteobacteria bacterium]|nr:DUF484 family protein [Alphaproteobacteria bacterium]USO05831.1 MAG: DUF484 family protein [Rhodospirillales bacterium]HOO81922.1 DUF484 family protein [Alphaproteobacteria bacterium]
MTNALTDPAEKPMITKDDLVAFLKDNPNFLSKNPDVVELLLPPKKRPVRGQPADFQSYMIERLKTDKDEALQTTREIVESSRANMNNQQRIHAAILRLLEAQNFHNFIHAITMDLADLLDVDIAVLVVEADGKSVPHIQTTGITVLPEGTVDQWMGDKPVLLQDNISGIEAIYGGGAALVKSQILLRVDISMDTPPAILAFGSRNPDMFNEDQATDQILFLARVIERTFRMWLSV